MVKKTVFETGFKGSPAVPTVTPAVPEAARSAAVMVAVSCELLLNEVALSLVFQSTTELGAKFDPFTVNRIAGLPAGAFVGEIEVICGVGGVLNVGPPHPSSKLSPKAAKTRRERCMMCSLVGRSTVNEHSSSTLCRLSPQCQWVLGPTVVIRRLRSNFNSFRFGSHRKHSCEIGR